jgi:rubrerythrin
LAEFAATEADSGWQFLQAFECVKEPKNQALLFQNFLEEKEHASRFDALVRSLPGGEHAGETAPRQSLVSDVDDVAFFLAYMYAGELDISQEFTAYANATAIPAAQALFRYIQEEEEGHHEKLWAVLVETAGSEAAANKLVKRARRKRAWTAWLRFWSRVGESFMGFWLALVYWVFGPFVSFAGRRRLKRGRRP